MMGAEPRGIVKLTFKLGQVLLFGIKLQLLWWWWTLRGGIVLGAFPALASCVKLLLRRLESTEDDRFGGEAAQLGAMNREFGLFWRQSFKDANGIGFISGGAIVLLMLDLAVNRVLIRSAVLQYGLIVLLVAALIYLMYILTVFGRYQLSFWQYFRQAFVISVARFTDTLAILVGTMVATALVVLFPALSLVALVPLYLTPVVWFSLHACRYVEAVIKVASDHA
ncbi:DUF624 domain-containing protein [Lacticaseibacillus parakribbianus]|uniref:DUF624 domain-containing protein n=1 Tax=Lacticaseibacillus parakribbianus TaxID=2970927 RepID=UPI0021CB29DB|nr:DUF624 domain-containing protein [Lacticaseibacillus parakribbianus]